jgi:hypothetical protein
MFATLALIATLGIGTRPQPIDHLRLYRALNTASQSRVSVWLNKSDPYSRGDRARVYVSAEQDAYLTVLRIDTDGRVRVLFPQDPWDDNWVPGGRTFEVEDRDGGRAFRVDDPPGAGYVFAIASEERFDYSTIVTERDHWDYRTIADGQVRGDPYVAVTDLAERIVGAQADYDYDLAQYDVERHYEYPRFVCYDCHAYAPYYAWNPYGHTCVRFRVVIYDDPYYYPYRYYGGRRVVVVRPRRPQPRYVFVDNDGRRDYVTRIQNRPRREEQGGGDGRDEPNRPRRAEDVGGRGTIPAPGVEPRRRPTRDGSGGSTGSGGEQPGQPRRIEPRSGEPQSQPQSQPERRRTDPPAGLEPQKQPPREEPRREEPPSRPQVNPPSQPRREEPKREESTKREEPRREEPRRQEPQRQEPRSQPRAEPRREESRRQDPPAQRAEPKRESGGNGGSRGGSSGPELRRRRG